MTRPFRTKRSPKGMAANATRANNTEKKGARVCRTRRCRNGGCHSSVGEDSLESERRFVGEPGRGNDTEARGNEVRREGRSGQVESTPRLRTQNVVRRKTTDVFCSCPAKPRSPKTKQLLRGQSPNLRLFLRTREGEGCIEDIRGNFERFRVVTEASPDHPVGSEGLKRALHQ